MPNQPLVSVLISAYNHEPYIQNAIKSIIGQTYRNIELHIIDDGSRDKTFDRINEMAKACHTRFAAFSVQRQENSGTCCTLNRLLGLAQGKYVYLIASDDMAKGSAIQKLVTFLEANDDFCLAVGDNQLVDRDGKLCFWDKNNNLVYDAPSATYTSFAHRLMHDHNMAFASDSFGSYAKLFTSGNHVPNGYLIRKRNLDYMERFTKEAPLEDWYLMLQLAKTGKFKFFDTPLFFYRQHATNTSANHAKMLSYEKRTQTFEVKNILNVDISKLTRSHDEYYENADGTKRFRADFIDFCIELRTIIRKNIENAPAGSRNISIQLS